ncbi:hypothetical protein PTKIN_Ptkin06aG0103500 [Pterospermum kingtungense]
MITKRLLVSACGVVGLSRNLQLKVYPSSHNIPLHNFHVFKRFPTSSLLFNLPFLIRFHHLKVKPFSIHYLTHPLSSSSSLLHSCKNLQTLKQLHASLILSSGNFLPTSLASSLITLYAHFTDLESAVLVFKSLKHPDTIAWNLIIKSHVDFAYPDKALLLYRNMRKQNVKHDRFTFPIINRAVLSSASADANTAKVNHCVAVKMGFGFDLYFGNTMVEVYGKCGCFTDAFKLFDEIFERDLVTWTSIISGCFCEGDNVRAFTLFNKMRMEMQPNSVTLIVLLQGCSQWGALVGGRLMHGYAIRSGVLVDGLVQNSVLKMYTKMGSVEEVETFFTEIRQRDTVSWNTLISYYSLRGDVGEVADRFCKMQHEVKVSTQTLTLVISAFAKSGDLSQGEKLHCCAIKLGLHDDVFQTSLLDFYAKCGMLKNSVLLFRRISSRNSIAWSAMLSGYIQNGFFMEAIALFKEMQAAGLHPGAEILGNIVNACIHLGGLQTGKEIHGYSIRNMFHGHEKEGTFVELETSILNMYIRCGSISSARTCFSRMLVKDIVAWTSMIEGYGIHGLGSDALDLFDQMLEEGVTPNGVTFLSLLAACSHSGLVSEGCNVFHSMKWRFHIEPDLDHYTCMVDLLGRAGKLKEALATIMKMMAFPDSRIWGALLAASRVHGHRKLGEYAAQQLLELEPDNVGYHTLLSNVQASTGRWAEVEEVRRAMFGKDLKKQPGWSYIEENGHIHCFVSGDKSHNDVHRIYQVLACLIRKTQELDIIQRTSC